MLAKLIGIIPLLAGAAVQAQTTATATGTDSATTSAVQKTDTTSIASALSTGSAVTAATTQSAATTTTAAVAVASNYINGSSSDNSPVHVNVDLADTSRRNKTAPMLYGNMFEDISHSGDGGIYAELLRNRAFQGTPLNALENPLIPYGPVVDGWAAVGNVSLVLDRTRPLSWALPVSLQMVIPPNTTGEVGLVNYGWWGFDVSPGQYNFSVNVLALNNTYPTNATTTMTASLRSNTTNETWASAQIGPAHLPTFRFSEFNTTIYNNATAPDGNNVFMLTMQGEEVSGMTLNFALFSLFPETFKNRPNGLRKDLASSLYAMEPKFVRVPGGNNLEGPTINERWKWWETLGPLSERPGRVGTWGYYNTQGLGLMEHLYWAEDMDAEVVLGVYAGYSLDGTSYPEENMGEVLQEALDEIEFVIGDTSTKWGSKRAELGHPEPFPLTYVEIGNEDFFSPTYGYRFPILYDGIHSKYPDLKLISSAYNESYGKLQGNVSIPEGALYDKHNYDKPSFFLDNFNTFDHYQENPGLNNVDIFLGEFSVFQLDTDAAVDYSNPVGIHIFYPQMIAALGESVYLLGAERNPNVVKLASYAPLLQHRNSTQWTPNLISFEAQQSKTVLSASFWWQWLFSRFRGCETLPADTVSGNFNPLYWGSTYGNNGEVYFKLINTGNQTVDFALTLDGSYTSVNATTLQTDNPNAFNYVNNQTEVYPAVVNSSSLPQQASSENGTWTWTVPVFSITVFQFNQ